MGTDKRRWAIGALALLAASAAAWMGFRFVLAPDRRVLQELRAAAPDRPVRLANGALADCPDKVYGRIRVLLQGLPGGSGPEELPLRGACRDGEVRLEVVTASGQPKPLPPLPLFSADEARSARIHIASHPPGAPVELDQRRIGITPLMLDGIDPGAHHLRIRDPRFLPFEERFTIARGQAVQRIVELQPGSGRLAVASQPSGAEIFLDGTRQEATTPAVLGPMPAGRHRLELRRGNEAVGTREVEVPTAGTEFVSVEAPHAPRPQQLWRDAASGVEFVWVPAGCYRMGCGEWTDTCETDEGPVHDVCVEGFWLGRYEVTQAQWRRVMGANPTSLKRAPERAVANVSWREVQQYLRRLNGGTGAGYRLPSEAEWEYACRSGGRPEKYAGGREKEERLEGLPFLDKIGWVGQRYADGPFPAGEKQPNGLGLYDMTGNVWEWTQDTYGVDSYGQLGWKNPVQDAPDPMRVARGGSWWTIARYARCSQRFRFDAEAGNFDLGFRLVKAP
jgi:formylglycine-generating enzyme required for sulfatase activity